MAKYETMLITTATLDEEATTALVGKFKSLIEANGTIDSVEDWGKRRLAYPINKKEDGYYVVYNILAPAGALDEVERTLRIADNVVRHKLLRLPDHEAQRRGMLAKA